MEHHPQILVIWWGPKWNSDATGTEGAVANVLNGLAGSAYNAILTQYFDNFGFVHNDTRLAGAWIDNNAPGSLSYSGQGSSIPFTNEIAYAKQQNPSWTVTSDTQFMIFPQQGTSIQGFGTSVCAWHTYASSDVYAVVPFQYDQAGCRWDSNNAQATTRLMTHEYAETATDPQINAWCSQIDGCTSSPSNPNTEIADLCQHYASASMFGETVSLLWDNTQNGCSTSDSNFSPITTLEGHFSSNGLSGVAYVYGNSIFVQVSSGTSFGFLTLWWNGPFYGNISTLAANVDGNSSGRDDLIAVDTSSTWVLKSTGSSFAWGGQWSSGFWYGTVTTLAAYVVPSNPPMADLIAVNNNSIYVMKSTGTSFVSAGQWSSGTWYGTVTTLAANVDGNANGLVDLVAVDNNSAWVLKPSGQSFVSAGQWSSAEFYGSIATLAGDVGPYATSPADLIAVDAADGTNDWVMLSTGSSFGNPQFWYL